METLHPDVYVIEAPSTPRIVGIGTSVGGFVGTARKGKTDRLLLATSYGDALDKLGEESEDSYLYDALKGFFGMGGTTCFIARVVGAGALVSESDFDNQNDTGGAAVLITTVDLSSGIDLSGNSYIRLNIDNAGAVDIDLAAGAVTPTAVTRAEILTNLNAAGFGAIATAEGTQYIRITSPTTGVGSEIELTAPTAARAAILTGTGLNTAALNPGNFAVNLNVNALGVSYEPYVESATFAGASPTAVQLGVSATEYNLDINIDGLGLTTVDITGDNGASGSYALALVVSNINTALNTAYTTVGVVYARVISGLNAIEIISPTMGAGGSVVIAQSAANPIVATTTFGFSLAGGSLTVTGGYLDITGNGGRGSGYAIATIVTRINRRMFRATAYGGSYGSANGSTGIASNASGQIRLTSPTTGVSSTVVLNTGPAGASARFEAFGIAEDGTNYTVTGGNEDATLEVLGIAESYPYTITGSAGPEAIFSVAAESEGAWGDNLRITTEQYRTVLTANLVSGATTATLGSVVHVKPGHVLRITDGTTTIYVVVRTVNSTLNQVTFQGSVHATIAASTSLVHSSTHARRTTTTAAAITSLDTSVELTSAGNIKVGTRALFDDGVNPVQTAIITSVSGNTVGFAAGLTVNAGAIFSTLEFDLRIENGIDVEVIPFLSIESTSPDFIEKRVAGDGNESKLVEMTELVYTAPTNKLLNQPLPVVDQSLSGGNDGAAPTDNDYIGDASPKTGLNLFDTTRSVNMISTPGITSVAVTANGMNYAEERGDLVYIAETPLVDDEPLEALQYRNNDLNIDTSYGALYYPWLKVVDPFSSNADARRVIPPCGHVQGAWADIAAREGVWVSPANMQVRGALGLTHSTSDGEQDLLNPDGINCIREEIGRGIRIMGGRTLAQDKDGRHYISVRRLLNFIKGSIKVGNRFAIFRPNQPSLWRTITAINSEFLKGIWQKGGLFPDNDVNKAFFVKCDKETNPQSEIDAGRVNTVIGINPPIPAEFVVFKIGLFDGGSDVEELVGSGA